MRARIGLLSSLAMGCLLAAPVWQSCSTPSTTTDAGTTVTDGGPADAGLKDGGPVGGQVGENCINNNSGQLEQSTCTSGLLCLPLSQENTTLTVCTRDCTTSADCGAGNVCWSGICWQGCGAVGSACNQSDFSCQAGFVQGSNICVPDCRLQTASFCSEFFGYPFNVCDGTNGGAGAQGSCESAGANATCGPTMACPEADQACFPIPGRNGQPSPGSVCVDDCTAAGLGATCRNGTDCVSGNCVSGRCAPCSGGFACDATLKTCQIVPVPNYGPCNPSIQGACPTGTNCINFGQGVGQCLPPCTMDGQCPTAGTTTPKCALPLSNNTNVCALDCSAAGSVCPANTACAAITGLGSFCFPAPGQNLPTDGGMGDAGPADAGSTPDDAGSTPDDAGSTPDDAGSTPDDAGSTPDDAGSTPDDAGTTPDDAGN